MTKRSKNNQESNKRRKIEQSIYHSDSDSEYIPMTNTILKQTNICSNSCSNSDYQTNMDDELDPSLLKHLSKSKKQSIQNEYKLIKDRLNYVPNAVDIMQSNAPFEEKCNMVRKLDIIMNMDECTNEYVEELNKLICKVENYSVTNNYVEEDLKLKIQKSNYSQNIKSILFAKYNQMMNINVNESGHHKIKEWLDYAMQLPLQGSETINGYANNESINQWLVSIQKSLDAELYGLNNVKEQIMTFLCKRITNKDNVGNAVALLGPPGTGKTCLVRSLAKALNIPFTQISMGGATDSSFLDGHNYTYEGAGPGIIVKSLINMKCNNGIIFFDEIDKLSGSDKGKEVAWNLLHITDFSQNSEFRDKYLAEIPIDLSKIWFIYSMNDISNMDNALIDRMPILQVGNYDLSDKLQIAKNYMIPKIIKNIGLNETDIIIKDDIIKYIISMSNELGVRKVEQMLNNLFNKINLYKCTVLKNNKLGNLRLGYSINNFTIPLNITKKIVEELL